jgi:CheY-like chemotaxis protein
MVVHDSAAVLELIEQSLGGRGNLVFTTRDPFEAVDVAKRVQVDLLIVDGRDRDPEDGLVRDLRTIQPGMRTMHLGPDRVSLARLRAAIAAELKR